MRFGRTRGIVIACGAVLLLGASARESFALCDWLCGWLSPKGCAVTTYTPPYAGRAVAVAPMASPAACSYVPQVSYRTICQPVPVSTCLPVRSCDPCTGCPVTTYRPITVYAYRPQMVPFTTYRMVCPSPCAPCARCAAPVCGPCGTGVISSAPMASGCPTCATTPSVLPSAGLPSASNSVLPSTSPGPSAPPGSAGGSLLTSPPPTYAPPSGSPQPGAYQGTMAPIAPGGSPVSGGGAFLPSTRLRLPGTTPTTVPTTVPMSKPQTQPAVPAATGRTAVRPVVPAAWYQPVSLPRSSVTGEPLDIGGWAPVK